MSESGPESEKSRLQKLMPGPLAWMARNSVAANILMLVLLAGGAISMCSVKQEVFPEVDLDLVLINVPYPGASPEEVEEGVILAVEEAVRGIDGVDEVRATATDNLGVVAIKLTLGTDGQQALNDVESAVNRIQSFPKDVEEPRVFMASNRYEVVSLAVYGDHGEQILRDHAERIRDELLQDERITYIELQGIRPLEISVDVPQDKLVEHDITLDQVATAVARASVDAPGGGVKTASGEVLIKTDERREIGREFEGITLLSRPDGTRLTVGDVAEVNDGFAETDMEARFDGKRAVMVKVFRSGEQTPLEVSAAVSSYVVENADNLPPGISVGAWFDMSEFYGGRIDLLKKNALIGLVLVFVVLGLFLEIRLAFWVTLGIPISFLGAFLFLPSADVSINMISLFAFILVLGMVVDDAIIVGESIYKARQAGMGRLEAAVKGVKEVAVPVCFAIITTIVAYTPLLFVPGVFGKFFRVIPLTVISVLVLSLVESLLILPAHLSHGSARRAGFGFFGALDRMQARFGRGLERAIQRFYVPVLGAALRNRYLTFAIALSVLLGSAGYVAGRMQFTPMPRVDSDVVFAMASMPHGTSIERTAELEALMRRTAREVLEESGGEDAIKRAQFSLVGGQGFGVRDPGRGVSLTAGSHLVEVGYLLFEDRPIKTSDFAKRWREKLLDVPGLERISFNFATGPAAGMPVHVELSHRDLTVLEEAAEKLAAGVATYEGVYDLDDGFAKGKQQVSLKLTPEAQSLGVSEADLARQVRASFYGSEAARQQRGRDELRVYVRRPRSERESQYDLEEMLIRTPLGGWMPLGEAATIEPGRAETNITRLDGRRVLTVTADVDENRGNARDILAGLQKTQLADLMKTYPGLGYSVGGAEKEFNDANVKLLWGLLSAMIVIFALLAVVFRSYIQPVIVMLAIPFGFVGAAWGHVLLGFDMSLMSIMGIVALAGVVINDSLLLVVTVNRNREDEMPLREAVVFAGARRFRPILLTSLTTFFGLVPMILETSVQAQFMVPMAVALGFGVMFATFITLLLVPAAYMMVEDARSGVRRLGRAFADEAHKDETPPTEVGDVGAG